MSIFYFNRMPVSGPWGGGNKTLSALVSRLTEMGHLVTGEPRSDVDVVFCVDPRPTNSGITYRHLFDFASSKKIPLVHRVGDVGTHGKPDLTYLVKFSTALSSRVIFTSEWARDYVGYQGDCVVIPNGALSVFYSNRRSARTLPSRLRVVTHHWSNNPMKGITLYEQLADDIETGRVNFDFTYIGRSSDRLANRTMPPVDADDLARLLPEYDIYLSASQLEAGANHIVEAMACGLPVVYSKMGGSIPEYCGGRGLQFADYHEMVSALHEAASTYQTFWEQSNSYRRTINDVVDEYVRVLCEK